MPPYRRADAKIAYVTAAPDHAHTDDGRARPDPVGRWEFHAAAPARWWPDALLVLGFVVLTAVLLWPSPVITVDILVRDVVDANRPEWAYWVSRGFNLVGQGFPLAVVSAVLVAWRCRLHRTIRPLLMYGVIYAFVGLVILPKIFFDRVAPHWPDAPPYVDAAGAVLFSGIPDRQSYPSGHAVNTIVWYFVIVLMLGDRISRRTRAILLYAPPAIIFLSQTYLGFHWVSDTPAGIFLGLLIIRVVSRVDWATMPLGFLGRFDSPPR